MSWGLVGRPRFVGRSGSVRAGTPSPAMPGSLRYNCRTPKRSRGVARERITEAWRGSVSWVGSARETIGAGGRGAGLLVVSRDREARSVREPWSLGRPWRAVHRRGPVVLGRARGEPGTGGHGRRGGRGLAVLGASRGTPGRARATSETASPATSLAAGLRGLFLAPSALGAHGSRGDGSINVSTVASVRHRTGRDKQDSHIDGLADQQGIPPSNDPFPY